MTPPMARLPPGHRPGFAALSALLVLQLSGCAAVIERGDGPDVSGVIESSDEKGLTIRNEAGGRYRIEGKGIRNVDHPGNVVATVGGVLMALGALQFPAADEEPDRQTADNARDAGRAYLIVGFAMIVGGLIPYYLSHRAAWDFQTRDEDTPEQRPQSMPMPAPAPAAVPAPAPSPTPPSDAAPTPPAPDAPDALDAPTAPTPEPTTELRLNGRWMSAPTLSY